MTKTVKIIGGIVGGVILLSLIAGSGNDSNTESVPNSNASSTQSVPAADTPGKEKITIKNSVFQDKGYGLFEVVGEAVNNDTATRNMTLKATFYTADGKIMGTATGGVNDLAAGETKTFNLVTTDKVTGHANFKVQVDTLY